MEEGGFHEFSRHCAVGFIHLATRVNIFPQILIFFVDAVVPNPIQLTKITSRSFTGRHEVALS